MICQSCGLKEGVPRSFYRDGVRVQGYFCADCRAKIMSSNEFENPLKVLNDVFIQFYNQSNQSSENDIVCGVCRTRYSEFLETGYVGCAECYKQFAPYIQEIVYKVQQKAAHVGKNPQGTDAPHDFERLRAEIERAVGEQNYLEAARLKKLLDELEEGK